MKTLTPAEENALKILDAKQEFIRKGYVTFYRLAAIKSITPKIMKDIMPNYNTGYLIGLFKGVYECVIESEKRAERAKKNQMFSCQTIGQHRRYTRELLKESWIFSELWNLVYVKKHVNLHNDIALQRMFFDVELVW